MTLTVWCSSEAESKSIPLEGKTGQPMERVGTSSAGSIPAGEYLFAIQDLNPVPAGGSWRCSSPLQGGLLDSSRILFDCRGARSGVAFRMCSRPGGTAFEHFDDKSAKSWEDA